MLCSFAPSCFGRIASGDNDYQKSSCAELGLAALFGWLYMLYFARGLQAVGHLVVTIAYMLVRDVFRFVLIYMGISLAYAQTIFMMAQSVCLTREGVEPSASEDALECADSFWEAWWSLFLYTIGDIGFLSLPKGYQTPIYLSFSLISNILILNLLIALTNNTFEDVAKEADWIWMHQWANYILLAERRWSFRDLRKRLWAPDVKTRHKRALAADILLATDPVELSAKHKGNFSGLIDTLKRPDSYHLIHEVVSKQGTAEATAHLAAEGMVETTLLSNSPDQNDAALRTSSRAESKVCSPISTRDSHIL